MDTVNMKDFVPIASWVVFIHLFLMQKMAWLMNFKLGLWALHIKFLVHSWQFNPTSTSIG